MLTLMLMSPPPVCMYVHVVIEKSIGNQAQLAHKQQEKRCIMRPMSYRTVSPRPTESASNSLPSVLTQQWTARTAPQRVLSCLVMTIMEGFLQLPILVDHSIKPILKLILHSASRLVGPFPSVIGDAPRFFHVSRVSCCSLIACPWLP